MSILGKYLIIADRSQTILLKKLRRSFDTLPHIEYEQQRRDGDEGQD
jgi:hypothetical protein